MVRARLVQPDSQVPTLEQLSDGTFAEGPLLPAVSRNAQLQAVVDAMTAIDVVGGMFTVLVERTPTGVPNERVTTKVLVQIKDRVDARAQAERDTEIVAAAPTPAEAAAEIAAQEAVAAEQASNGHAPTVEVGADGEAVDLSDVPEHLRGI